MCRRSLSSVEWKPWLQTESYCKLPTYLNKRDKRHFNRRLELYFHFMWFTDLLILVISSKHVRMLKSFHDAFWLHTLKTKWHSTSIADQNCKDIISKCNNSLRWKIKSGHRESIMQSVASWQSSQVVTPFQQQKKSKNAPGTNRVPTTAPYKALTLPYAYGRTNPKYEFEFISKSISEEVPCHE